MKLVPERVITAPTSSSSAPEACAAGSAACTISSTSAAISASTCAQLVLGQVRFTVSVPPTVSERVVCTAVSASGIRV